VTAEVDPSGSATSPAGFKAAATYCGIKEAGDGVLDLGVLVSDVRCTAAAVFTKNRLNSAPIDLDRAKLVDGRAQAIILTSGIANSSTGQRGVDDAEQMAAWAAERTGIASADVLVSSTGVIGHFLEMDKLEAGMGSLKPSADGGVAFARSMMTTDTVPKHGSIRFGDYTLGGCAKGSGMIHPNMATMLAYLTTDAPVDAAFLRDELRLAVDLSFNMLSIDGDTSPSDTVVLMANGVAGGETINASANAADEFRAALQVLCTYLAREMTRDAEGATRLITINVTGAAEETEARQLVREISTSYLVKTAVNGADPNWGRIVAVVGRSAVAIVEESVHVDICGTRVFANREPAAFNETVLSDAMRSDEVVIDVHLGAGDAAATGWGCDLTAEYVHINADYHT